MNYQKIYNQIIERSRYRGLNKKLLDGYFEKHHIIPKCLNGTNDKDNLCILTGREHYLAHWLLWKIHKDNYKLMLAYHRMIYGNKQFFNIKVTGKQYENLKYKHSQYLKTRPRKAWSEESKLKLSKSLKGRPNKYKGMHTNTGPKRGCKFSEEHKINIGLALKDRKFTEITKNKMRKPKSIKHTEEWKLNHSIKMLGNKGISFNVIWNNLYFSSITNVCNCYNISRISVMKTINDENIKDCFRI